MDPYQCAMSYDQFGRPCSYDQHGKALLNVKGFFKPNICF
jgi:hypothetical protein